MRWSQLYTPLGLAKQSNASGGPSGDLDPNYKNLTGGWVDNLYAALDFGCLMFAYTRVIPNATGVVNIVQHAFPITPQRLGEGFIVGRERVVTKVSGGFAPLGVDGPLCVMSFDRDGWLQGSQRAVPAPANVTASGGFAVVVPDGDCDGAFIR